MRMILCAFLKRMQRIGLNRLVKQGNLRTDAQMSATKTQLVCIAQLDTCVAVNADSVVDKRHAERTMQLFKVRFNAEEEILRGGVEKRVVIDSRRVAPSQIFVVVVRRETQRVMLLPYSAGVVIGRHPREKGELCVILCKNR